MRFSLHNIEHKVNGKWLRVTEYPCTYYEAVDRVHYYKTYFSDARDYRVTAAV